MYNKSKKKKFIKKSRRNKSRRNKSRRNKSRINKSRRRGGSGVDLATLPTNLTELLDIKDEYNKEKVEKFEKLINGDLDSLSSDNLRIIQHIAFLVKSKIAGEFFEKDKIAPKYQKYKDLEKITDTILAKNIKKSPKKSPKSIFKSIVSNNKQKSPIPIPPVVSRSRRIVKLADPPLLIPKRQPARRSRR